MEAVRGRKSRLNRKKSFGEDSKKKQWIYRLREEIIRGLVKKTSRFCCYSLLDNPLSVRLSK